MDTQATTKQTVVLDVHQQSPAARLIAPITQHRIDSLGLVPLVSRTGVPAKQIIWARHIRDEVLMSLLPDIAEGTKAEQALVVACNLHPEAKWWLEHSNTAKNLIAQAAARLQQMAENWSSFDLLGLLQKEGNQISQEKKGGHSQPTFGGTTS